MKAFVILIIGALIGCGYAVNITQAATGCTLNDVDRDIKRIFPDVTGFKTEFITIEESGGAELKKQIEVNLGDKLDSIYENIDVPYAYYTVFNGKDTIGYVHGVNQKGRYGGMQIILASNPSGVLVACYYQKISSPESKAFRNKSFGDQFVGLSLDDFYTHKNLDADKRNESLVGKINDPSLKSSYDFNATLRGVMKNLILLDELLLKRQMPKNPKTTKE